MGLGRVNGDIYGPAGLLAFSRQVHAEALVVARLDELEVELREKFMTLALANGVSHNYRFKLIVDDTIERLRPKVEEHAPCLH